MKRTLVRLLLLVLSLSAALSSAPPSEAQLYFLCIPSYCSTRPATHPCWCNNTLITCGQGCAGSIPP